LSGDAGGQRRPLAMTGVETALGRPDAAYLRGVAMVMLAGGLWSLGGLLVRSMDAAGAWQILFVRSSAVALSVLAVLLWRYRGDCLRRIGDAGLLAVLAGALLGVGFCGFIFALMHTSVANAVFMLSATPFLTAVLGWLLLGEAIRRGTWLAMAVVLVGIGVMVGGGIVAGAWLGNLRALLATAGFAGFTVALRRGRRGDMLPAVLWAGLLAAAVAGAMAPDLAMTARDVVLSAIMGAVLITGGMMLFTAGSRTVPSAELALLSLTEVVLGPLWVWLAFAEVPRPETLLGGAIVLAAIAGRALTGMRRKTPPFGAV
jgi:drug/metabolite transporter (DMT)-like permease